MRDGSIYTLSLIRIPKWTMPMFTFCYSIHGNITCTNQTMKIAGIVGNSLSVSEWIF